MVITYIKLKGVLKLNQKFIQIMQTGYLQNELTYRSSTLSLAHWVLRKNLSEDLIDGSLLKQLTRICE